jgi:hypothetical protein
LNTILRQCRSRDDFITTALELRESKKVKRFREYLREFDSAVRIQDWNKVKKNRRKLSKLIEGRRTSNSIIIRILNILDKLKPFIGIVVGVGGALVGLPVNGSTAVSAGSAIAGLGEKMIKYHMNRRLVLIQDLKKQLEQAIGLNNDLKRIFGSKLPRNQIKSLHSLNAYHEGYISENAQTCNKFRSIV